jgi:hypothetical protein
MQLITIKMCLCAPRDCLGPRGVRERAWVGAKKTINSKHMRAILCLNRSLNWRLWFFFAGPTPSHGTPTS